MNANIKVIYYVYRANLDCLINDLSVLPLVQEFFNKGTPPTEEALSVPLLRNFLGMLAKGNTDR